MSEVFRFHQYSWDIDGAKKLARNQKPKLVDVKLAYSRVPWKEVQLDREYAKSVNLKKPLIYGWAKIQRGKWKKILFDGHHRLFKAYKAGFTKLPAITLSKRESARLNRNPLPILNTKKEDALLMLRTIIINAFGTDDLSLAEKSLVPDIDPRYTPLYIVSKNVDPEIHLQLLKLLLSEHEDFYRSIVDEIESHGYAAYEGGVIPEDWLREKKYGRRISIPLEDVYSLHQKSWRGATIPTFDEVKKNLGYGSVIEPAADAQSLRRKPPTRKSPARKPRRPKQ